MGWSSCLLTFFCPCVAFGLNRRRAFAQSAILWGLVFFILVALRTSYCRIEFEQDDDSPDDDHFYDDDFYDEDDESSRTTFGRELEWVCYGVFHSIFSWTVAWICELLIAIALIVLGIINRTGLRNKFDLPGHVCTDCLLWTFCPSCVLCQETRTLWYNSVKDGIWNGPQVYVVPNDQDATNDSTPYFVGHQAGQEHIEMRLGHTAPPRQQLVIGHGYPAEQENFQALPTV